MYLPPASRSASLLAVAFGVTFSFGTTHLLQAQTYRFQATIASVDTNNNAYAQSNIGLVAGDTLTGTIVIDRSSPDTLPGDSSLGVYLNTDPANAAWDSPYIYHSYVIIELPVGTYGFGNKLEYTFGYVRPTLTVVNNADYQIPTQTFSGDTLRFQNQYIIPEETRGPSMSRAAYRSLSLLLNDPSGIAFDSEALPVALDLAAFSTAMISYNKRAEFTFQTGPDGSFFTPYAGFTANITSITGVPEPSAFILSILAGTACLFRRHRRI